jgi:NADH-quinone oxidoreductase subunit J
MELTWESVAFLVFGVFTLGGGLLVVISRNLFHSALYLMLSLFGVAGLLVLLVAPFLAAVQVLVYIGAIAVLVLFVIMLTRQVMGLQEAQNTQWPAAAVVAILLFGVLALALTPLADEKAMKDIFGDRVGELNANFVDDPSVDSEDLDMVTVEQIGEALVTRDGFVLPFEIASILLTAALIGAIVVAREDEA